jgi:hypothetical protein
MDPQNAEQDKREVQLEGERLERVRRNVTLAQDQLMNLADVVLTEIRSGRVAEELAEIRVSINAENAASGPRGYLAYLYDAEGNCVGSYRDPPGICSTQC